MEFRHNPRVFRAWRVERLRNLGKGRSNRELLTKVPAPRTRAPAQPLPVPHSRRSGNLFGDATWGGWWDLFPDRRNAIFKL
jgi:hypothetical protein